MSGNATDPERARRRVTDLPAGGRAARALAVLVLASMCALRLGAAAPRAAFEFGTPPALPTLPTVALNGRSQTIDATMANFSVIDTRGTKSGWNVTAAGESGTGLSPVFKQYCPKAKCGTEAEGYVTGGQTMAANSLKLNSTGAKFAGGTGAAPTLKCAASCNLDSAAAVKIASAATGGAGEGTWTSSGFSATSLTLAVPTTLRALPSEEVYRVNILWTLSSGP